MRPYPLLRLFLCAVAAVLGLLMAFGQVPFERHTVGGLFVVLSLALLT